MGSLLAKVIFQPPVATYGGSSTKLHYLKTKSGAEVPCIYIDNQAEFTILFSHGNAEDIGMVIAWFQPFSQKVEVNLLAYDYEGYGVAKNDRNTKEPMEPSEQGCYNDVEAAFAYLTLELDIPPSKIIVWGRSLGSGPSCYLAELCAKQSIPLCGLIIQSGFKSIFRTAFDFRFTLPGDMFPNVDRIANVTCKTLIIHGTKDEVVPFYNGEGLFFNVPPAYRWQPKWVMNGGHNNIEQILSVEDQLAKLFCKFLYDCSGELYQKPIALFQDEIKTSPSRSGIDINSSSTAKIKKKGWFRSKR